MSLLIELDHDADFERHRDIIDDDEDEAIRQMREDNKRKLFSRIASVNPRQERMTSKHPLDVRINLLVNGKDELQPDELPRLWKRINETRVLSIEDQALLVEVRKNLQRVVLVALDQGRRFVRVLTLTWRMFDCPDFPDRPSGTVRCQSVHLCQPENLVGLGARVRDLIRSWHLKVYIELQHDELVDDGKFAVVQQRNGAIIEDKPIGYLFAVIVDDHLATLCAAEQAEA